MKKIFCLLFAVITACMCFTACSKSNVGNEENDISLNNTYDSVYASYDESVLRNYDAFCNAVINGEAEMRINTSIIEGVEQLFYTSFPMSYLVNGISRNPDGSGVVIEYKNEPEVHKQKVKDFANKIEEIKTECGFYSANDGVYLLNVYNYVASNIKITAFQGISVYETIMKGEGNVFTYSNMFEYLLRQKGIDAYHILAEDNAGGGWGLSCAMLNGQLYFFDVGSEFYSNGGKGLDYFAMSFEDFKNEGLNNPIYSSNDKAFECFDDSFKACRSCKEWSLIDNTLSITGYNSKTTEIKLN